MQVFSVSESFGKGLEQAFPLGITLVALCTCKRTESGHCSCLDTTGRLRVDPPSNQSNLIVISLLFHQDKGKLK